MEHCSNLHILLLTEQRPWLYMCVWYPNQIGIHFRNHHSGHWVRKKELTKDYMPVSYIWHISGGSWCPSLNDACWFDIHEDCDEYIIVMLMWKQRWNLSMNWWFIINVRSLYSKHRCGDAAGANAFLFQLLCLDTPWATIWVVHGLPIRLTANNIKPLYLPPPNCHCDNDTPVSYTHLTLPTILRV